MHESHAVGFSAEMLVASKLCAGRNIVSIPFVKCSYDLLADDGERIWRIQVKQAWFCKGREKEFGKGDRAGYIAELGTHTTGTIHKRASTNGFDFFAAVCTPDLIYLIPTSALKKDGRMVKSVYIKPLEMLDNTRADSKKAAQRWEPWKNNFKLR